MLTPTGDGKSTIIKMLIESQGPANKTSNDNFPTPVVGGSGISTPTSADIHLYIEPESELTRFPRIYADCEGLEGGEKMPVAHGWIEETLSKKRNEMRLDETSARKMRDKAQRGIKRKLKWAITDEKRKREYTVRELYPRLLYTFSNVVVFVLANERYVLFVHRKALLILVTVPLSRMHLFAYWIGLPRLFKVQPIKVFCPMSLWF